MTADLRHGRVQFAETLLDIVEAPEAPEIIAIDIPIGLPDRSGSKGRTPERLVRPLLGARQSSVFSIPSRAAVYAAVDETIPEHDRFRHACAIARDTSAECKGVSKQAFGIFRKIIDVDRLLREREGLAARVFECHPETSFWVMNGETPLPEPKKVKNRPYAPGLDLRRGLLVAEGFDAGLLDDSVARACGAGLDDLIDAGAAAWTAARIACGQAKSFPEPPEHDSFGLPVAIWA
jgi:predicted RNase H-like nuclease